MPGDDNGNGTEIHIEEEETATNMEIDNDEDEDRDNEQYESSKFKTCSHYRQLTSRRLAEKTYSSNIPDLSKVNCCSVGGDKSKFGTHDIEDLVKFGVQPNVKRDIAIYRNSASGESSFGMTLSQDKSGSDGVIIKEMKIDGAAAREGSLEAGDSLMSVNRVGISPRLPLKSVTKRIKDSTDPLMVDVYRGDSAEIDVNEYSSEAACPYYLSRALSKRADLIFCPYNYVLDPTIRNAMEIDIEDAIVILDEAHNVEDTLRSTGSDKFKEFELIEMLLFLNSYAVQWTPPDIEMHFSRKSRRNEEDLGQLMPDIAHELLLLVEKVIGFLKDSKAMFEKDEGINGVTKATAEYNKFKCPDNKEWEVKYFGPNGSGIRGKPIGCNNFFSVIKLEEKDVKNYEIRIKKFEQYMSSQRGNGKVSQQRSRLADRIVRFVSNLCDAFRLSEHYYISSVVSANGNLDFATGNEGNINFPSRFKRKPQNIPSIPSSNPLVDTTPRKRICNHKSCNALRRGYVSHDEYCDGSLPQWESALVLNLLTPAVLMGYLSKHSRSLVFASGTLAPLQSLCAELNLLPPDPNKSTSNKKFDAILSQVSNNKDSLFDDASGDEQIIEEGFIDPFKEKYGRLQVTPKPLEAKHVINLERQLLSIGIGHFPDGSPLSVRMSNYNKPGFHEKLGGAIATIIENIPYGGVLGKSTTYAMHYSVNKSLQRISQKHDNQVFVPSFSFLKKCENTWQNSATWDRLLAAKVSLVCLRELPLLVCEI